MAKARVAILRTRPESVVEDYRRLCALAGMKDALDPSVPTILKDNITWHLVFPGVNTTPWQLEGTILALHDAGLRDLVAVHNHTVVTIPERGEEELKFTPIYRRFDIPVLFNFRDDQMKWVSYRSKRPLLALPRIFHGDVRIPDFFVGKNIVHLPTVKTHSYTQYTGAMKVLTELKGANILDRLKRAGAPNTIKWSAPPDSKGNIALKILADRDS